MHPVSRVWKSMPVPTYLLCQMAFFTVLLTVVSAAFPILDPRVIVRLPHGFVHEAMILVILLSQLRYFPLLFCSCIPLYARLQVLHFCRGLEEFHSK